MQICFLKREEGKDHNNNNKTRDTHSSKYVFHQLIIGFHQFRFRVIDTEWEALDIGTEQRQGLAAEQHAPDDVRHLILQDCNTY